MDVCSTLYQVSSKQIENRGQPENIERKIQNVGLDHRQIYSHGNNVRTIRPKFNFDVELFGSALNFSLYAYGGIRFVSDMVVITQ